MSEFHIRWRRIAGIATVGMLAAGGTIMWLDAYENQEVPQCEGSATAGICEGAPDDVIEVPAEQEVITLPTPTQTSVPVQNSELPPCPSEDSENCYWDAANMGNGEGRSFVNVDGEVTYTDEPWVQPCTDWLADHPIPGMPCKGEPIEWEFSNAETLVCGEGAKPAIDYSPTDAGWWAYCEPALVEGEK